MKNTKKNLTLLLLVSMSLLVPNIFLHAQRNQDPVIVRGEVAPISMYFEAMPNGFLRLDWVLEVTWYYEDTLWVLGTSIQHVEGIMRTDNVAMLRGYGLFTSNEGTTGLSGTFEYTLGNNLDMNANEIWAFRMRIFGGTGDFEGIEGTATAESIYTLLYLNVNPWE
jgi:hypothetical protein